jgi:outer membrane receptor protein involved in Fe transport
LKIYPVKRVTVNGTGEFVKQQISEDAHKSISIFDVGVSYKIKKVDIRADVRNLFNTRSYSYSLFSGIDAYNYDFALRGREYTVSFIFRR